MKTKSIIILCALLAVVLVCVFACTKKTTPQEKMKIHTLSSTTEILCQPSGESGLDFGGGNVLMLGQKYQAAKELLIKNGYIVDDEECRGETCTALITKLSAVKKAKEKTSPPYREEYRRLIGDIEFYLISDNKGKLSAITWENNMSDGCSLPLYITEDDNCTQYKEHGKFDSGSHYYGNTETFILGAKNDLKIFAEHSESNLTGIKFYFCSAGIYHISKENPFFQSIDDNIRETVFGE